MSIEKYVTKSIVIEAFDNGEHDRAYKLFTREHGLVMVHAKSIRKLESKLRAHILPRTVSLVTLVKGREVWRLVGAEEQYVKDKYIYEVTQLIRRFIRGEGVHKTLYDKIILFLESSSLFDEQKARLLLYYLILVDLGYADAHAIGAKDIKEYSGWSIDDMYTHLLLAHDVVRKHIHEVLQEIQL